MLAKSFVLNREAKAGGKILIPCAIALLSFALRVYRLGAQSFWWDEVYVALVSHMPFPDWLSLVFTEERSHPPGFFFLMSLWTQLGIGEFVVRYASVLWGTISVPLVYTLGARLGGRRVGVLSALLLALSPYHVWYSQEARMYAPQVFFALLSSYLFLRLLTRVGRPVTIAYAATSVAGLYVFYLVPLILLAQLIFLILKLRRYPAAARHWFVANGVAGIIFLPWLIAIVTTGGFARAAIGWIQPARWYDPPLSIYTLVVGTTNNPWILFNWLTPLIFAILAFSAISMARRGPWRDRVSYSLLWLLVPFCLIFVISLPMGIPEKRSLYSDRYLIPELPALIVLVSFGAVHLFQRRPRLLLSVLALAALPILVSMWAMYFNPAYVRDDWRSADAYLASNADPKHDQVAMEASLTWPYSYYEDLRLSRIVFYPDPGLAKTKLDESLGSKSSSRLWLLTATILGSAHRFLPTVKEQLAVAKQDIGKRILDQRYPIESEMLFQGVLVTAYRIHP
jgi:mannosyltransferase